VPALNITTEELMKGGRRTEEIGGRNEETAMWRDATSGDVASQICRKIS
jgi:hypothetical protein